MGVYRWIFYEINRSEIGVPPWLKKPPYHYQNINGWDHVSLFDHVKYLASPAIQHGVLANPPLTVTDDFPSETSSSGIFKLHLR